MAGPVFTNNAVGTLAASYAASATALTLTAGQGALFPSPDTDEWFPVTIVNDTNQIEIVHCTSRTADTLQVQRGQEGTLARTLAAGEKAEHRLTAAALNAMRTVAPGQITTEMLADGAVTSAKIADLTITGPDLAPGSVSQGKLIPGVAIANLGYTPVHQGGGAGQGGNTIYMGFASPKVSVQVDSTPYGNLLAERNVGDPSEAGYRGLPANVQNNNYTFGLTDAGKAVIHQTGDHVYYIAANASVPFQGGTLIKINNLGGTVTIAPPAGGHLIWLPSGADGNHVLSAPGSAIIEQVYGDTWWVYGFGLS